MKTVFIIFLISHGLIHVLGFVKAFGLAEVKGLQISISKFFGFLWFLAAFLFAISAALFLFSNNLWWIAGFTAVLVSQTLIFFFWKDSKYGLIANIIVMMVVTVGYGIWNFRSQYQKEVEINLNLIGNSPVSILKETDVQKLPNPVQKYIRNSGAVGNPKVKNFKIEFDGKIRKNEQSEWMPFTSEQYNFMGTSTRLFFMDATMFYMPVAGFHSFINGNSFMDIRLFSLFTVQFQSGNEMAISETVTFFNDMCCMAPATLIDNRIRWIESDSNKVQAEFSNNGITISAWLYFNEKGELINFVSEDRYAYNETNGMQKLRWSTPLSKYKEINGYNLAGFAETIYTYPDGDFCYGVFKLNTVRYNINK